MINDVKLHKNEKDKPTTTKPNFNPPAMCAKQSNAKKTFIMADEIKFNSGTYFIKNGAMFIDTEERAIAMALEHQEFLICVSDIAMKQDETA